MDCPPLDAQRGAEVLGKKTPVVNIDRLWFSSKGTHLVARWSSAEVFCSMSREISLSSP
jgi:hypothetical protein